MARTRSQTTEQRKAAAAKKGKCPIGARPEPSEGKRVITVKSHYREVNKPKVGGKRQSASSSETVKRRRVAGASN